MNARAAAEHYVEEFVQEDGAFRQSGPPLRRPSRHRQDPPRRGRPARPDRALPGARPFVEFTSLIHQIQSTFDPDSPESKRQVLDPLADAELLVLDELGAQQPTPWVRDILYLIINTRYTRRLPTLFTTNYRLEPPPAPRRRKAGAKRAATLDRGRDPESRPGVRRHRCSSPPVSPPCSSAGSTRWPSRWCSTRSRTSGASTKSTGPASAEPSDCLPEIFTGDQEVACSAALLAVARPA